MNKLTEEQKDQALFSALVFSLHAAGMQQLGKIASPITGKVERDLEQAQGTIDMMEMLKRKTQNHLSETESKLLNRLLAELQMNYVDEAQSERKKATVNADTSTENHPPEKGGTTAS